MRYASATDVMDCIVRGDPDDNNVWPSDWYHHFNRYHIASDLILEICKHRKEPAFATLVDIIESCIEAHQSDRENGLI